MITKGEKEVKNWKYVGIDVSEVRLDVCIGGGKIESYENSEEGIKELVERLRGEEVRSVVLEATGKCEIMLISELEEAAIPYNLENPYYVRSFAKSQGKLEKTDKIDAKILCRYGEVKGLEGGSKFNERNFKLKEALRLRKSLVKTRTRYKNRLRREINHRCIEIIEELLIRVEESISEVEKEIRAILSKMPEEEEKVKKLQEVPGVGEKLAITLVSEVPELGKISRRKLSKLVGLAPLASDSGKTRNHRHIRGGRYFIRNELYMSVLSAIRFNPLIRENYNRLLSNNKARKVAIVACMRKLLIYLNAMLKHGVSWSEFYEVARIKKEKNKKAK